MRWEARVFTTLRMHPGNTATDMYALAWIADPALNAELAIVSERTLFCRPEKVVEISCYPITNATCIKEDTAPC